MFEQISKPGSIEILEQRRGGAGSELTDMSLDEWDRVLRVNLTGQFLCAREAALSYGGPGLPGDLLRLREFISCPQYTTLGGRAITPPRGRGHLMKTLCPGLTIYTSHGYKRLPNLRFAKIGSRPNCSRQLSIPFRVCRLAFPAR